MGVAREGGEILVLGDFQESRIVGVGVAFHKKWPERTGSVKTDLIAVERNLVSGNKTCNEVKKIKQK